MVISWYVSLAAVASAADAVADSLLSADQGCEYDKVIEINLSEV